MGKRKPRTIRFHRNRLPHWEVEEGQYFVTITLAGAIPSEAAAEIRRTAAAARQLKDTKRARLDRKLFADMERWLDAGRLVRHLSIPSVAQMVMSAIRLRGERGIWNVREHVIMPNHVHLFFRLEQGNLGNTMKQFKRWTAHRARKIVQDVQAPFWHREWFDHWSRSDEEDEDIVEYIRQNPVKAGLVSNYLDWPYGGWAADAPRCA